MQVEIPKLSILKLNGFFESGLTLKITLTSSKSDIKLRYFFKSLFRSLSNSVNDSNNIVNRHNLHRKSEPNKAFHGKKPGYN